MNPIRFALRHPITVMVIIVALAGGSALALTRMRADIFPQLNLPVIYVCQPYGGMSSKQMEGLLTNYYEYHFLYISGIHHVESKNIQGMALMKLFFHPGTDMAQAMAEAIAYVNRSRAFMPPGTVPPFVMRFDTGSVPVGYLVLSSETKEVGYIQDKALFKVRPIFASLPGVSAPPPFGGSQRTVVIRIDPKKLNDHKVSPEEVVKALAAGNTISPAGNLFAGDQMFIVPINSMVEDIKDLGKIPIRPGKQIFLRHLVIDEKGKDGKDKGIEDGNDITSGYALVNGRRAIYILVTKRADASTLAVVNAVKANLDRMQEALPPDIKVSFVYDQSPIVTHAIWNLSVEGLLGALLTGLMVLVFLRDWRSVIVVVLNIPLALLAALIALALTGQTVNLMTLGGLALAVGILVDEATVAVENIHTQMARTGLLARAVRLGIVETNVPRLLAMLCILAVFIPSFFMEGAARNLFVPLALAVGFAMVASYLLSSTFVPVLSVWLLRHHHEAALAAEHVGFFARLRRGYSRLVERSVGWRRLLLPAYLGVAGLLIWLVGGQLGTEIFPAVDAGQFQIRLKAATGTRFERTEELVQEALAVIQKKVGHENIDISLGYVGLITSTYPINAVYQWMGGPEEAVIRVALKSGSGFHTEELKENLREELPKKLGQWLHTKMTGEGYSTDEIKARVRGLRLSFEPADIVNEVMSFGAPTPIEIVVNGPKLAESGAFAEKIRQHLETIPALRDLQIAQALDYPTLDVWFDREKGGLSGITADDFTRSVVPGTSSSRFTMPNYWADPASGIGYQVQVEMPIYLMKRVHDLHLLQIKNAWGTSVRLENVADVKPSTMPGQLDRYNMRRVVSLTANIHGADLGRVARQVRSGVAEAGKPPRDVRVDIRGQVEPMEQILGGLGLGLLLAVAVIFLLLTAYFQSVRLAVVVMSAAPAVIAGVALALWLTGTTLNIQSFMGAIMAIGVAVANAILLVTFAERLRREEGKDARTAASDGARQRLRPILMTTCAMIAGMLPMALGLGEGGEQVAPLGRAVIGGLLFGTLTTLFVLPAIFAVVQGTASTMSVSLDPEDPESSYYDQELKPSKA